MEIFDNLDSVLDTAKNVIGTAANAIAEKTVEIKDASKTKYKIYELKSDIKKMYSAIGKLTYAQKTEGADNVEDVSQLCLMIKEKKDKIAQLQNGMGDIEFKCPSCGKTTSGANSHCPNCGANMTTQATAETDADIFDEPERESEA